MEHQLFDVFNNAIISFYRSEDEGGGDDGGGGGNAGDGSSRNESGVSSGSGGGAATSDSGGAGDCGNSNTAPTGNDGVNSGVASGGMTTNDALLFHEKCGTLIKLSNNNKTAERRRPLDEFNNGVVMTNRPLRHNEMFEVCGGSFVSIFKLLNKVNKWGLLNFQIRIDKLVDKWSGSIEIGVTTHNPNNLDYPATMTNLRSGETHACTHKQDTH